jgi:integrase
MMAHSQSASSGKSADGRCSSGGVGMGSRPSPLKTCNGNVLTLSLSKRTQPQTVLSCSALSMVTGSPLAQTFDETTREAVALRLRLHVYPHLGDYQLAALRPSVVQAWARGLQQQLAPSYVRVVFANLSSILQAAVDDGIIGRNPCRAGSVKPPAPDRRKVLPWPAERVTAVAAALPDRYRAIMAAVAGLGLRQGECFGLAVDDVDFLRGVVHVRRQTRSWRTA